MTTQTPEAVPTITRVVFRQLRNTGNYENVTFEAEALVVEGDHASAFAAARAACDAAFAQWQADKEAAERREREEWERQRQDRPPTISL